MFLMDAQTVRPIVSKLGMVIEGHLAGNNRPDYRPDLSGTVPIFIENEKSVPISRFQAKNVPETLKSSSIVITEPTFARAPHRQWEKPVRWAGF